MTPYENFVSYEFNQLYLICHDELRLGLGIQFDSGSSSIEGLHLVMLQKNASVQYNFL